MKYLSKCYLVIIVVCIMSTSGYSISCEFKAGFEEEFPYHFTNDKGVVVGIDADILKEVFLSVGCKVIFLPRPWKRTLNDVQKGNLDIAIGAKYLDERAKFAYYSMRYKSIRHWLFTREGEYKEIDSIDSFLKVAKEPLGVVRGWGYPPEISNVINKSIHSEKVTKVNIFEQLPKMLDNYRLDAIIANPITLGNERKKVRLSHKFISKAQYGEKLYFLFSKKTVQPELVVKFNNALLKLINGERYQQILLKYSETNKIE